MYTQEIICPSCGQMTIVNVIDNKGETSTPCNNCKTEIKVVTDRHGKVQSIYKSSDCFIATAVYGTPHCDKVLTLRDFRDNHLIKYKIGRVFINFYYTYSPSLAKIIEKKRILKKTLSLLIITPTIKIIEMIYK